MNTQYREYVDKIKAQDPEIFLGSLVWYQVVETAVHWDKLSETLTAVGLSQFVPRRPKDVDVFRRCAPNGHRKRVSTTNNEIHVNYLIRQVRQSGGSCTKHIVAETVDSSGETLDYEDVYSLTYDGEKNELRCEPIGAGDATAGDIASEIESDFDYGRGFIDANGVRRLIARILDEARATAVRTTGGVYFVMSQHGHLVDALEQLSSTIPGAGVHSLPLIDDGKQRDMLRKAYEAETIEAVEKAMAEVSTLLQNKDLPVTSQTYARLSAHFSDLMNRNQEYSALLEDSLANASSQLAIFRQQMTALLKRVG